MARLRSRLFIALSFVLLLSTTAYAQDVKKKEHSPTKATIMSACLPGLGQIYNGKWWKVPIIYAGFGGLGYLSISNYHNYRTFLTAYKLKTGDLDEGITPTEEEINLAATYLDSQLQTYKESYRHDFELFTILLVAWYGLNIVDATVDGHLYSYDISDDLSLNVDPVFAIPEAPNLAFAGRRQTGLSFSFCF